MLAFQLLATSSQALPPQVSGLTDLTTSALNLAPEGLQQLAPEVSSALAAALQEAVPQPKNEAVRKQEHVLLEFTSKFAENHTTARFGRNASEYTATDPPAQIPSAGSETTAPSPQNTSVRLFAPATPEQITTSSQVAIPSQAPETATAAEDAMCGDWAAAGECSANPAFMLSSCKVACAGKAARDAVAAQAVSVVQSDPAAQPTASNASAGALVPEQSSQNGVSQLSPSTSLPEEQPKTEAVSEPAPATQSRPDTQFQAETQVSKELEAAILDGEERLEEGRAKRELADRASRLQSLDQPFHPHAESGEKSTTTVSEMAASKATTLEAAMPIAPLAEPTATQNATALVAPVVSTPVVASPASAAPVVAAAVSPSPPTSPAVAAAPAPADPAAAAPAKPALLYDPTPAPAAAPAPAAPAAPQSTAASNASTVALGATVLAAPELAGKTSSPSPPPAPSPSKTKVDKTISDAIPLGPEDEAQEEDEEEEDADEEEGEMKTDEELWAASAQEKEEETQTEEDRERWDETGLQQKSGHVWMSDEETKDPEWGEDMDEAEMDWAKALARESIEKQEDPLAFIDCRVNPLSPVKGNIDDEWCVANCITKVSKEWPCPAEHCACTERPKRVFKAIKVQETCPDREQGCPVNKPYECTSGFLKYQCASVPWKSKIYCAESCLRKEAPPVIRKADVKMGLPDCAWTVPRGCSMQKPYECTAGPKQGQCSASNWGKDETCEAYCLHIGGFPFAPTDKEWRPTPRTMDQASKDSLRHAFNEYLKGPDVINITKPPHAVYPHYVHDDSQMEARLESFDGFRINYAEPCEMANGTIVSNLVGISLYSPKYVSKSQRLLNSCDQVGVCCLTAEVPSDAFGPKAPEGSPEFRFKFIAQKPLFMNYMTKRLNRPMVWLDVDMEFHQYPRLFTPGSWKEGPRDIVIFNFWGNETDTTAVSTASGVVFMNNTLPAQALMQAWAESSAWPGNDMAPDDQVLDKLLNEGGWLHRCTFGWMPASYLRHLPNYYRGVRPVIDHDRGNMDGLLGHSNKNPELPPARCSVSETHFDPSSAVLEMKRVYTEALPIDKPWCDEFFNLTEGTITEVGPDTTKEDMARKKRYRRTCFALTPPANDWWCTQHCNQGHCPETQCTCK